MTTIDRFEGQYAFLSNFHPSPVLIDMFGTEMTAPTLEHAFQASKVLLTTLTDAQAAYYLMQAIMRAPTPAAAKRKGRRVPLNVEAWDEVSIPVMHALLRRKFAIPELGALLLATGDADLIEGNYWGDRFWGQCAGVGENHLGRLLMEVRDELAAKHA